MAKNDSKISTTLELNGEKQFRDAVKKINSEMSLLSAKLKNAASDMALNGESTEKLLNQYNLMKQIVEESKNKMTKLNEAIAFNADNQQKISTALETAKEKQKKLADEVERTQREYGKNSEQAQKAATEYEKQAAKVENLQTKLDRAQNSSQRFKTQLAAAEGQLIRNTQQLSNFANAHGIAQTSEQRLNSQIQISTERNRALNERIQALNSSYNTNVDKLRNINERQKAYKEQVANSEKKVKALTEKLDDSKDKYNQLAKALKDTEKKFGENSDEAKIAAKSLEKAGEAVEDCATDLEKAKSELSSTRTVLSKFNNEVGSTNIGKTFTAAKDTVKNFKDELSAVSPKLGAIVNGAEKILEVLKKIVTVAADVASKVSKITFKVLQTEAEIFGQTVKESLEIGLTAVENYTKAVGITTGAIAGYTTKTGMDFDAQMSTVRAITNATSEEFERLKTKALEMGKGTVSSATDAGKAMEYMGMAGWTVDEIEESLQNVVNLAIGSGEDIAQVSDIVTDAMTAFGMKANESEHFVDVLAKTATSSNTNVEMLGETFRYVAPLAGVLGYSIDDMAIAIGLMANQGIKASQAGTALRSFINRLAAPTEDTSEAMEELGISLVDSYGNAKQFSDVLRELRNGMSGLSKVKQIELGKKIAGQFGAQGVAALANTTEEDLQRLTEQIQNAAGAAKTMSEIKTDNLSGDIKKLKNNVEALAITNNGVLSDSLRKVVQEATALVNDFNVNGFESFISNLTAKIPIWTDNLSAAIEEDFPKIIEKFNKLLTTLVRAVPQLMPTIIRTVLPELIQGTTNLILEIVAILPEFAPQLIEGAITLFGGIMSGLNDIMDEVIKVLPETMKKIAPQITKAAPEFLRNAMKFFTKINEALVIVVRELAPHLPKMVEKICQVLNQEAPTLLDSALTLFEEILKALTPVLDKLMENLPTFIAIIGDTLEKHADDLTKVGIDLFSVLADGFSTSIPTIVDKAYDIIDAIIDEAGKPENAKKLEEAGGKILSTIAESITGATGRLIRSVSSVIIKVKDYIMLKAAGIADEFNEWIGGKIGNLLEDAYEWGKDMVKQFIEGVKSLWGDWEGLWEDFGGAVYDLLHHTHPDEGPLKDDYTWMPDMMMSFAKGIKDNKYRVFDEINSVAEGISDGLSTDFSASLTPRAVDKALAYENGNSYNRNYNSNNNTYNIPVYITLEGGDLRNDNDIRRTAELLARETQYNLAGIGMSGEM